MKTKTAELLRQEFKDKTGFDNTEWVNYFEHYARFLESKIVVDQFKVGEEVAEYIFAEGWNQCTVSFISSGATKTWKDYFNEFKNSHPELFGNTKQPNPLELNMRTDGPGELYEGEK